MIPSWLLSNPLQLVEMKGQVLRLHPSHPHRSFPSWETQCDRGCSKASSLWWRLGLHRPHSVRPVRGKKLNKTSPYTWELVRSSYRLKHFARARISTCMDHFHSMDHSLWLLAWRGCYASQAGCQTLSCVLRSGTQTSVIVVSKCLQIMIGPKSMSQDHLTSKLLWQKLLPFKLYLRKHVLTWRGWLGSCVEIIQAYFLSCTACVCHSVYWVDILTSEKSLMLHRWQCVSALEIVKILWGRGKWREEALSSRAGCDSNRHGTVSTATQT